MDASDVADFEEAVAEFCDQTCTFSVEGVEVGTWDCVCLPGSAAGGVAGGSPDARDASTSGLSTWTVYVPGVAAAAVVPEGATMVSSFGVSGTVGSVDTGRTVQALSTFGVAEQRASTPVEAIVLRRWDADALTFVALPAQTFQVSVGTDQDPAATSVAAPPASRRIAPITLMGPLGRDVQAGDAFAWHGGAGSIVAVDVSDRVEARGTVAWS